MQRKSCEEGEEGATGEPEEEGPVVAVAGEATVRGTWPTGDKFGERLPVIGRVPG